MKEENGLKTLWNDKEALELWNWFKEESLKDFQKTYDLLGINKFDSYTGESYYKNLANDVVEEIEKKGISKISEGATIVDLGENKTPALIKKSDGTTLYITRDIAALIDRKNKYNFDEILYVVGSEQTLHFEQIKEVLQKWDMITLIVFIILDLEWFYKMAKRCQLEEVELHH